MWPNLQKIADLVTFTEEILNRKLQFLCCNGFFNIYTTFLERFLDNCPPGKLSPNPQTNPNPNPNPNPNRGQFSSGAIVRIPLETTKSD